MIRLKRIYDKPAKNDGFRVLVDGIWPRGSSKKEARLDLWLKQIAPSMNLRKWFGHDPEKWGEFKKRYRGELKEDERREALERLKELAKEEKTVTLLYAAKNTEQNNAVVLKEILE